MTRLGVVSRERGGTKLAVATRNGKKEILGPAPSNDGAPIIETELPFSVSFTIEGVVPILFHRWSNESVAEKAKAKKGSAAKKTDDVESYVYRDDKSYICLPGEYVYGSICDRKNGAAKYRQDPRSPRKSALDLYRAAVAPLTLLAPILGQDGKPTKKWDVLDERRVTVQQSGITRQRPSFHAGWRASFVFQVNLPEYVDAHSFLDVLTLAGRAVGVGDYRPTYGRFQVVKFEVIV
jgi:hypothetical protein